MVTISCGGFVFTRDPSVKSQENKIESGSCIMANSITCAELSIDTLDFIVFSTALEQVPFITSDDEDFIVVDEEEFYVYQDMENPLSLEYGEEVILKNDDTTIGVFYLIEKPSRVGVNLFRFSATSAIGLMENIPHNGGIYTRGISCEELLADIIPDFIPYSVQDKVKVSRVYGWLPIGSCRSNLRQLLFAVGASIRKTSNGTLSIEYVTNNNKLSIPDSRRYTGGSKSPQVPASKVEVTEHTFFKMDSVASTVLFNNIEELDVASNQMVKFEGPYHSLQASEGLTLHGYNANYAIVSGTGELTGKPYIHQEKVLELSSTIQGLKQNIKQVTDAYLVSIANSENVAKRVLSYFSGTEVDNVPIVTGSERPGDFVEYTDAYYDPAEGIISSLEILFSATLKANMKTLKGYTPVGFGNFYSHSTLITQDGQWVVPANTTKIHAVIFQAGQGGWSGEKGENSSTSEIISNSRTSNPGKDTQFSTYEEYRLFGKGGKGGKGGKAGSPGKVMRVTINVTPGQAFAVKIGSPGAGGVFSPDGSIAGSEGGHTTFGVYSSKDGYIPTNGYIDVFTGTAFAVPGEQGIDGGDGSGWDGAGTGTNEWRNIKEGTPVVDPDGTVHLPGASPETYIYAEDKGTFTIGDLKYSGDTLAEANSGRGGGPAAGSDGIAGSTDGATVAALVSRSSTYARVNNAPGANGAKPALPVTKPTLPGSGGYGGHGGGGAGGSGGATVYLIDYDGNTGAKLYDRATLTIQAEVLGIGGEGVNGSDGAPGGVLLYY